MFNKLNILKKGGFKGFQAVCCSFLQKFCTKLTKFSTKSGEGEGRRKHVSYDRRLVFNIIIRGKLKILKKGGFERFQAVCSVLPKFQSICLIVEGLC